MLDVMPIAELADQLGEMLIDEFPVTTMEFVRTALVVAEVDCGDHTRFQMACSDDRAWVQIALLEQTINIIEDRIALIRAAGAEDE